MNNKKRFIMVLWYLLLYVLVLCFLSAIAEQMHIRRDNECFTYIVALLAVVPLSLMLLSLRKATNDKRYVLNNILLFLVFGCVMVFLINIVNIIWWVLKSLF